MILLTYAYLDKGYIFGEDIPNFQVNSFEDNVHTGEFRMILWEDEDPCGS